MTEDEEYSEAHYWRVFAFVAIPLLLNLFRFSVTVPIFRSPVNEAGGVIMMMLGGVDAIISLVIFLPLIVYLWLKTFAKGRIPGVILIIGVLATIWPVFAWMYLLTAR